MFTVPGELYAKQGAAWPVDVIVIEGKKPSKLALPAASPPRVYDSWESLKDLLTGDRSESVRMGADEQASGSNSGERAGAPADEARPADVPVRTGVAADPDEALENLVEALESAGLYSGEPVTLESVPELITSNALMWDRLQQHGVDLNQVSSSPLTEMPEAREQIRLDQKDPQNALENWLAEIQAPI
jgi:hypothetical protein